MRNAMALVLFSASLSAWAGDPATERTWKAKCASCHGVDGKGQTEQGKKQGVADMSNAAWQKKFTDDQIKAAIANGVNETRDGKKKEMEAYKNKLRPDQIDALVALIRGLGK
jgi:mono/diheme cytochrome c family protein